MATRSTSKWIASPSASAPRFSDALNSFLLFLFGPIFDALRDIEAKIDRMYTEFSRSLTRIEGKIDRLLAAQDPPPTLVLRFGPVTQKAASQGETLMQVLTDEQKCTVTLEPQTAAGNPAKIDGIPAWAISDPSVLDLAVAEDGMSAVITTKGPLGTSQISVVADADLGEGTRPISSTDQVQVVAAEATTLGIKFGAPELK